MSNEPPLTPAQVQLQAAAFTAQIAAKRAAVAAEAARPKPKRGGFFIVDRGMFHKACALGLRPAIALLILARFTQGKSPVSRASSNAIEKRTGIGRKAAREAIAALETAGIVTRSGTPTRPVHRITRHEDLPDPRGTITDAHRKAFERAALNSKVAAMNPLKAPALSRSDAAVMGQLHKAGHVRLVGQRYEAVPRAPGEAVYLPNELVDGIGENPSPVELIRQTGDPLTLRLLIDLYTAHRLDEWHGVDPRIVWHAFKEVYRREMGSVLVLGWKAPGAVWANKPNTVVKPHLVAGEHEAREFFPRIEMLERLGLLVFVPYVVDGDGAPVYPCSLSTGHPMEVELGAAAREAARNIVNSRDPGSRSGEPDPADVADIIAVVPLHMTRASLVGVARLTFRPKTAMTAAWMAELGATHAAWMARFKSASLGETKGIAKAQSA